MHAQSHGLMGSWNGWNLEKTDVACWYESSHRIASHNTCAMLQYNQGIDGTHGHDINLAIM